MKYYDMEQYWQWLAIEMPIEREDKEEEEMTKKEQWLAIEMPIEREGE